MKKLLLSLSFFLTVFLSFGQISYNAKSLYMAGTSSIQLKDTSTFCSSNPCPVGTLILGSDTSLYVRGNGHWKPVGGGSNTLPTQSLTNTYLTGITTESDSLFYGYPQATFLNNSGVFKNYGDSFVHSSEWTGIVANAFGFSQNLAGSFGGTGYAYATTANYNQTGWTATHTFVNENVVFVQAGLNDIRRGGNNYKTMQKINGCQTAIIANTLMQQPVPANNGTVTAAGTWTTTSGIGDKASVIGGLVRKSGAAGSTLTWSFGGTGFVFGFFNTDEVTKFSGNGTYSIDGGTPIPFSGKGKTDGISDGITDNSITQNAIIVNNLNSATHTIVITALEDSSLYIDYFAIIQPLYFQNPIYFSSIPYLTSTGYAIVPDQGSIAASNAGSKIIRNNVLRYSFMNLPVWYVEVNDYYNLNTDVSVDNIHPNSLGYEHIAQAFLNNMKPLHSTFPFIVWDSLRHVTINNGLTINSWNGAASNYINAGGLQIFGRQSTYRNGPALELENDSGTSYVTAIDRGATFVPLTIRSGDMQIRPNNTMGSSGQFLGSDGTKVVWGNPTGTPAGSNLQIQFNNSGAFGANANFVWSNAANRMQVINGGATETISIGGSPDIAISSSKLSTSEDSFLDFSRITFTNTTKAVSVTPFGISQGSALQDLVLNSNSANMTLTADGRFYGNALHNNSGSMTGTVNQYIGSGTYTPTLTNPVNVSATTVQTCQWTRVGNVVHVTGNVTLTSSIANCSFALSLPITSSFTTTYQAGGSGGGAFNSPVNITSNSGGSTLQFFFTGLSASSYDLSFSASYEVR